MKFYTYKSKTPQSFVSYHFNFLFMKMRLPKLSLLIMIVLGVYFAGCKKDSPAPNPTPTPTPIVITPPAAFGPYVVGYFPSYRDPATVPDVKFKMCNVVNYAFANVNASGTVDVLSPTVLIAVAAKARVNNAKIFISVSGNTTDWQNMAATAAGRNTFIKSIMDVARQYNLHGVDIDWEFPSTSNGTDVTYTALMKELSDSCHRDAKYYLTAAFTAGKYAGSIRDAIKNEVFGYVDFFNVMAYDDFSTTVPYKHHSDLALANTCLNYWLNTRAAPANKCVLGIPAYGRPSGITQSNTILTYNGILTQGGDPLKDSAIVTAGGFTNYTIYYNGMYTAKVKAKTAIQRCNGIMMWEKGQDNHGSSSLLKAVCDTIGRTY
ncbi:MAG: glycoside hydrolase family 18 protein [Chitinophagaceae bacterium]|nr:glycoside hydrolase family 18 protein [Chitinophagaceae bacterium]